MSDLGNPNEFTARVRSPADGDDWVIAGNDNAERLLTSASRPRRPDLDG